MPEPLRVAVVGCGVMGRNHLRVLGEIGSADLVGHYDSDPSAAAAAAAEFSSRTLASLEEVCERADAVVLANPTASHAEVGCDLLERGLHVLVEKPIAASLADADRLLASAGDRVLSVGHVEYFNPAVDALLDSQDAPRFVVVERLSPFTRRSLDVDVVLDLMIHDLQILQALDPSPLVEVRAVGVAVLSQRIDIANARLEFESGCVANVTASRISAERVRSLRAFLPDRYLSLDYQAQSLTGFRLRPTAEGEDPEDPARRIAPVKIEVERREPLRRELESFVDACQGRPASYVDGRQGRAALECGQRIVAAIERKSGGRGG